MSWGIFPDLVWTDFLNTPSRSYSFRILFSPHVQISKSLRQDTLHTSWSPHGMSVMRRGTPSSSLAGNKASAPGDGTVRPCSSVFTDKGDKDTNSFRSWVLISRGCIFDRVTFSLGGSFLSLSLLDLYPETRQTSPASSRFFSSWMVCLISLMAALMTPSCLSMAVV